MADADGTNGQNGCLRCDDHPLDTSICDTCKLGEKCIFKTISCHECATYVCKSDSGSPEGSGGGSDSSVRTGVTVGVVLGFVVLLGLTLVTIYYFKYWKKRKSRLATLNSTTLDDEKELQDVVPSRNRSAGNAASISGIYHAGNRSSAATVVTRASNVLPVAYIPGVTAVNKKFRGRRMFSNNGDTRSHITLASSIFDGDDDDEEVEIPPISRERDSSVVQHAQNLTTAIRARPKLVQISEEEEAEDRYKPVSSSDQRSKSENELDTDVSLKALSNMSGARSEEGKQPCVAKEAADPSEVLPVADAAPLDPLRRKADIDDGSKTDATQINSAQSASMLQEEIKEVLHRDSDKDDKNAHDCDDDDDDEGSFILDVEVAEPRRLNTT